MPPSKATYDVIVVGAGPAGTSCATILADHGRDVIVLEKDTFPRHHIGESLMPQTYWSFKRLGLLDKMRRSNFPIKESVQFVSASGKDSLPYYFTDRDPSEWSRTWQIHRDQFDPMLIENAREHGAEIRIGVSVKRVLFEGDQAVGVRAVIDGAETELRAKVVVDATGMNTLLAKQLKIRTPDPALKNAAFYTYFKGAQRDQGRNAGATLVIRTREGNGWFWFIPLPDDITSVGVVAPPAYLCTNRGSDPLKVFEEEVAKCPGAADRLKHARRVEELRVCSDFSYRASRIAGPGWVLIGDAFCFLDPVYSSGLMVALGSGEMAADTIHDALEADDLSAERIGAFGTKLTSALHLLRQLLHAFYDEKFSFGKFMKAHPECKDHLVRMLIGDVFNDEVGEIFNVMRDWTELPEPIPLEGSPQKS